jgi:hypothetical protein
LFESFIYGVSLHVEIRTLEVFYVMEILYYILLYIITALVERFKDSLMVEVEKLIKKRYDKEINFQNSKTLNRSDPTSYVKENFFSHLPRILKHPLQLPKFTSSLSRERTVLAP